MRKRYLTVIGLVVVLVACGSDSGPVGDSDSADTGSASLPDDPANGSQDPSDGASGVSENAMATLEVDGETYTWGANEWTQCETGSASEDALAYFGDGDEFSAGTADFDFIRFNVITGKIFFKARVDGETHQDTTSLSREPALEMTTDGFTYSYTPGGRPEVILEVTC